MKRLVLTLTFFMGMIACYGQDNPCAIYNGRPMPDWIMGATPEPHNSYYYYKVFEGESSDREEARNKAIKKAFQQAMTFVSVGVTTDRVFSEVDNGRSVEVISEQFNIPIYFTCEFSKKTPDGTKWLYWILCQIAVDGTVDSKKFDTHFSDCNTHDIWDRQKADCEKGMTSTKIKSNARSLVASTFIPGMGQMLKKQGGSGAAFLISEIVVFGGGTFCYFMGEEQVKIMKNPSSYEEFKKAQSTKNIYNIAMYTAFGIGAAIHISNMVHAWLVTDKRLQNNNFTFVPAVIPTNEYSAPNYAMGAGVQIKF